MGAAQESGGREGAAAEIPLEREDEAAGDGGQTAQRTHQKSEGQQGEDGTVEATLSDYGVIKQRPLQ